MGTIGEEKKKEMTRNKINRLFTLFPIDCNFTHQKDIHSQNQKSKNQKRKQQS
jgi:hypothetical protein